MTPTHVNNAPATSSSPRDAPTPGRPWYANVPGLKILVPPPAVPAPTPDGDAGEDPLSGAGSVRGVDQSPFDRPGTVLRASARAAQRGFYAPRLPGAPSTTRQAEVMNTATLGAPTGVEGIVNGVDNLSSTMISHDAVTAYNSTPRRLTSPNVLILGGVGAGKSSFTKTVLVMRPLLLNKHQAVIFDKKRQGTAGEYTDMVQRQRGTHLLFSGDGNGTRLNVMDPNIMEGTGLSGQMELITTLARLARNDKEANEWEEAATAYALRLLLAQTEGARRVATAADLLPFLGRVPVDRDWSTKAKERFHQSGVSIGLGLSNLLEHYAGIFDGDTSPGVDLGRKLTSFDVSQLPETGPAIPAVTALGHQWLLGRLRRSPGYVTNVVYEEGWHMIGGPTVRLVQSGQKLSRALGICNVFVMHKGTDIPKDSPGYTVIQEAQTLYAFRQDRPKDAKWVQQTFDLDSDTRRTLVELEPGNCVFKYGTNNPETHIRHVRSDWETEVTETDEAMAAGNLAA